MRVVLYARLSIARDESVSIQHQLQAGRDYCMALGWTVVGEHVDEGVSASVNAPEDRTGWQAVLAHPEPYDVVLVWKVDRLARKVLDFLNADRSLHARGAAVACVKDPIDMTTPTGRAFATMLAVFAEMEADAIRQRVTDARRALIRAGRVPGGAAPFGYRNAPNPHGPGKVVQKDPATIGFVTEATGRALRGDSINSIAAYLDDVAPRSGRRNAAAYWTITVTRRMLQNPILAGMTAHNPGNTSKERGTDVLRDASGLPIIRENLAVMAVDDFRRLKARLASPEPYTTKEPSFLSGIVWCGECNRKMHRNAKTVSGKRVAVFQCQGKAGCGQQVSHLEQHATELFLREMTGVTVEYSQPESNDGQLEEINHQIAETTARMLSEEDDDHLIERFKALKDARRRAQEPKLVVRRCSGTADDLWKEDPRDAILEFFDGVRLTKGKRGRNFDWTRLSFVEKPWPHTNVAAPELLQRLQAVVDEHGPGVHAIDGATVTVF